jgi:hypothetical protein
MLQQQKTLSVEKMKQMIAQHTPESRLKLHAPIRDHLDLLSTQYDMIGEKHYPGADQLVEWIAKNNRREEPLAVIIICTGNTRRSMLGAAMGNAAATYYGLTNIKFYSGGTDPVAFNPRTIATLKAIGFEIEATGKEATPGPGKEKNPIYQMSWGKGFTAQEFSKVYSDDPNPKKGYAAILVCSEADAACPTVNGASIRIPVPYLDPKAYDDSELETAKYAERRDDIGRFMMNVMMRSQRAREIAQFLKDEKK